MYPSILRVSASQTVANATSHVISLPAGVNIAGLRLIVAVCKDGIGAATFPGSPAWALIDRGNDGGGASRVEMVYRDIDGTEGWVGDGSDTVTVTGASEEWASRCWLIRGFDPTAPPQFAVVNGAAGNPDPPNLAPTWGPADTLWIAYAGQDGSTTVSSFPTGFTDHQHSGNTGGVTGVTHVSASVRGARASLNPAVFVMAAPGAWRALLVAIKPVVRRSVIPRQEAATTTTREFTADLPDDLSVLNLSLDRALSLLGGSTWPAVGTKVRLQSFISFDGGATWVEGAGFEAPGGIHVTKELTELPSSSVTYSVPLSTGRKLRVVLTILAGAALTTELQAEEG